MDLNNLYHRHGVSLMMAERAGCECSRDAHRQFARHYAARIALALRSPPAAAA